MSFRKLILVFTITLIIIIASLLGFSYAWYAVSESSTPFNTTTTNLDTGLAVIFAQSANINVTTGLPIAPADIETKAGYSSFTIYADSDILSGYAVAVEIKLENISLDPALRNADFKYQVLENDVVIGSGTGATIGSNTSLTLTNSVITLDTNYNYIVRVWLQDSGVSQNSMMGKAFSATIKVNSAMRK